MGALLVGVVAVAGIAVNFTLLRLTQDAHDPVGKLSPRAVFSGQTGTTTTTPVTTTTNGSGSDNGSSPVGGSTPEPGHGDSDSDSDD